eukprot:7556794-Alexandrium_andersonii.AAC.1
MAHLPCHGARAALCCAEMSSAQGAPPKPFPEDLIGRDRIRAALRSDRHHHWQISGTGDSLDRKRPTAV